MSHVGHAPDPGLWIPGFSLLPRKEEQREPAFPVVPCMAPGAVLDTQHPDLNDTGSRLLSPFNRQGSWKS